MPLNTPPVGSAPLYARDKVTGETYLISAPASSEVEVDTVEPAGDWELWADTSAVGQIPPPPGDYMPSTGGTMTGPLVLAADPVAPLEASTKQYVDNHVRVARGSFDLVEYGSIAAGSAINTLVTFPPGLFTTYPFFSASFRQWQGPPDPGIVSGASAFFKVVITYSAITSTGAAIHAYFPEAVTFSASQGIYWMATQ